MYKYKRLAAYLIDVFVLLLLLSIALKSDVNQLAMVFVRGIATLETPSAYSMLLTLVIPIILYGCLTGYFGWTPGKYLMKLRVRGIDEQPVGMGKGLLREAVKWAVCSFLVFGLVWALYGIFTEGRTFYDNWLNSSVDDESLSDGNDLTDVQRKWRNSQENDRY